MNENIEIEEEIEANYEVAIFTKDTNSYIDCAFFYADDENQALEMAKNELANKYPVEKYDYRVEYIGSLQSDRGYEMSVERSLY